MSERTVLLVVSAVLVVSCGRTELLPRFRRRGELTLLWDDEHAFTRRHRALEAVPGHAEFGDVVSGSFGTRVFRVENSGPGVLALDRIEGVEGTVDDFHLPWTPLVLGPGASQSFSLTFQPHHAGRTSRALFRLTASNVEPGGESIDLIATGNAVSRGAPDIELVPSPRLDFGRVTAPQTLRVLEIRNAGLAPLNFSGTPQVRALRNATSTELCVGTFDEVSARCSGTWPAVFDDTTGLWPGAALTVPVRLMPSSHGLKSWTVTVASNDPDEPSATVEVVADVVPLPACDAEVSPTSLDFGHIGAAPRELTFTIRNRSSDVTAACQLERIQLGSGTAPAFTLSTQLQPGLVLGAGETLVVGVRASSASSSRSRIGGIVAIDFNNAPRAVVSLSATLGASCLSLSQGTLDFGSAQVGCATSERTVLAINACPTPLTIRQLVLSSAVFEATPIMLPITLPTGAAAPIHLRYRPVRLGEDRDALRVVADSAGAPFEQLTSLRGRGASNNSNVDRFQQGVLKADVLLVIDDSCSMSDEQAALASNLRSFLDELVPRAIDFRLGVVTTDEAPDAGLRVSPSGLRFLANDTLALEEEFRGLVRVGIDGSGA